MPTSSSLAWAVAFAFVAVVRTANADVRSAGEILQFGVAPTPSSAQPVDQAHFVYIPVVGPWLDIGRFGTATASLLLDGLCQDLVGLAFIAGMLSHVDHELGRALWHIAPWFPQSGGGGLSLRATF